MDVDRQVEKLKRALGPLPRCVGHYRPDIDGCAYECAWSEGCQVYRVSCEKRKVDTDLEAKTLGRPVLYRLIFDLLVHSRAKDAKAPHPMIKRGFERFAGAIRDALGFDIFPNREVATPGDLYVAIWRGKTAYIPLVWNIRVRTQYKNSGSDFVFARYHPNKLGRIQPVVELRCHPDTIFDHYPQAEQLAARWRLSCQTTAPIGAVAINVYPSRIEDIGRLNVRLLEDGLTTGMTLSGKKITCVAHRQKK